MARRVTLRACMDDDLQALLERNSDRNPAAQAAVVPGFGRCLVATHAVEAGDLILSVPNSLVLSPSRFIEDVSATGEVGRQLAQGAADLVQTDEGQSCLLALALLRELAAGKGSTLAPYIATLSPPEVLDHPLLWSAERLQGLLKGSHVVQHVADTRKDLAVEFDGLDAGVFVHDRQTFPASHFNADRYAWAHALILSRALPVQEEVCLVPYLDLANHADGAPHVWTFSASTGAVALVAGAPVQAGEQIFVDYTRGEPVASWYFFYHYGFVPSRSDLAAAEASALWCAAGEARMQMQVLEPSDPLREQKAALLGALGADVDLERGVEIEISAAEPEAMAPVLRLGQVSAQTAAGLAAGLESWQASPADVWAQLQRPIGDEVERLVAAQLVAACDLALVNLPEGSLEVGAMMETGTGKEARQQELEQAAARILLGERFALETCRAHWQVVLLKLG